MTVGVFEDVLTRSSAVSEQQETFLFVHAGEAWDLSPGGRPGCEDPPVESCEQVKSAFEAREAHCFNFMLLSSMAGPA